MKIISICNKIIEYSFYLLFLLVPLAFTGDNFELFEFNKMWLTFGLTLVIAAAWLSKIILQRRILLCRTPLDIPILLFLLSQIVSTIFSLDRHVSIWGYYSRFNGGLLSIISYIFLYYAFVTFFSETRGGEKKTAGDMSEGLPRHAVRSVPLAERLERVPWEERGAGPAGIKIVKRLLFVSLISGAIVALWGLPSHFGWDPTCFIFRGNFDVSCWTEAFQPRVRIFSTLGQPDWLAAYLLILLPISIVMFIAKFKERKLKSSILFFIFSLLFYVDLLFTRSKSAFLAFGVSFLFLIIAYLWKEKDLLKKLAPKKFLLKYKSLVAVLAMILVVTFFAQSPFSQFDKFTYKGIKNTFQKVSQTKTVAKPNPAPFAGELGGTDSGKIRLIVWRGAIDAFLHNPLFGTGVETFAFAYYRYRSVSHNLTSEWDYLYNKAHNEYLNYLATTGIFGLGTYLAMIGLFLFVSIKKLFSSKLEIGNYWKLVIIGFLSAYISILIVNFFGFSVVIVNIYFFLIPAFVFVLAGLIDPQKAITFPTQKETPQNVSTMQSVGVLFIMLFASWLMLTLIRFWNADKAYALGYNLDRVGQYQQAYLKLDEAVVQRNEPVFRDELSINDAILSTALAFQKQATSAAALARKAIEASDRVVEEHQNNVVFFKTRVRLFYTLSQADPKYIPMALDAIKKASELAPTDAKISYNLGVLYGQSGDGKKAVETLENTIKLKPDYRDAYYALGLFYRDLGENQKAIDTMHFILKNIAPDDKPAKSALKSWGEE